MDELRKKDSKELTTILSEKKEALKNFRFNLSGSKIKNIKEGLSLRREIARIKTLLNGRK